METYVGTSGYSYKEWKGNFYPEDLPAKDMLSFYASKLRSVEINNTFYRMPKATVLESWSEQVPNDFKFVIKASRRITHQKRLKEAEDEANYLFEITRKLEKKLGPVLFQLPPFLKKDVQRLEKFIELIPKTVRATFEFRHESWFDQEVYDCLTAGNCALTIADTDEAPLAKATSTADWGYLRLRRTAYHDKDMHIWIREILSQRWSTVFVFFKHEDEGTGPAFAASFVDMLNKTLN